MWNNSEIIDVQLKPHTTIYFKLFDGDLNTRKYAYEMTSIHVRSREDAKAEKLCACLKV